MVDVKGIKSIELIKGRTSDENPLIEVVLSVLHTQVEYADRFEVKDRTAQHVESVKLRSWSEKTVDGPYAVSVRQVLNDGRVNEVLDSDGTVIGRTEVNVDGIE